MPASLAEPQASSAPTAACCELALLEEAAARVPPSDEEQIAALTAKERARSVIVYRQYLPVTTEECRSMTIETCRSEATLRTLADLS